MAGSQFTEEQIRRSLLTLAKHAGNSITAQAELSANGLELAHSTLREWRNTKYPDVYRELHELHAREIEANLAAEFRELAQAAAAVARQAVDVTQTQMDEGKLRDPAGAARNLTVTAATAMDKLYLATDRPTNISEHRGASEILNALEARYGPNTVNSTAIEESAAQPATSRERHDKRAEIPAVTGRS